jgi:CRISPR-associated protein Cas2
MKWRILLLVFFLLFFCSLLQLSFFSNFKIIGVGPNRIKKYLRTQLTWVQNSLFEGELSESRFLETIKNIKKIIKPEIDSVTIYAFSSKSAYSREDLGIKKGDPENRIF